jgi:hypothetical protein
MKKLFLIALCATTIVYGSETPKMQPESLLEKAKSVEIPEPSSGKWTAYKEFIETKAENKTLTAELERQKTKKRFVKTYLQRYRTYSFFSTITCAAILYTSVRNPTFFSETFSSAKQALSGWKFPFFGATTAKITQIPASATNTEKQKEL